MKRVLFLIAAVICMLYATTSQAQLFRIGVKGGATFSKFNWSSPENNSIVGYQAGIMARVKIPLLGWAVNPELIYTSIGNDFGRLGYIQVPVNIQWGINLKIVRPFIQAGPYWGYAISKSSDDKNFVFDNINRSDWGIGFGGGVDLFNRFQVAFKYDWGFTNLVKNSSGAWTGTARNRAFNLSIGYFF